MNTIRKEEFGVLQDGRVIEKYLLESSYMRVWISTLGAAIISLEVPDCNGRLADVVLGFRTPQEYLDQENTSMGEILGRYTNRIANASLELDGKVFSLTPNYLGQHNIHGGTEGFERKVWKVRAFSECLELSLTSPDGEEGFPGNLQVLIRFSTPQENTLRIDLEADSDKDTVVNLAYQNYFNLNNINGSTIEDHLLQIDADHFTECNESFLPTGRFVPVANTPMDFREPHPIGQHINDDFAQLRMANGYDHNWVLTQREKLERAAVLFCPQSGRQLTLATTKPGLQVYTGNGLNSKQKGKNNVNYPSRAGVCLIPQYFPDSPHFFHFPSPVLRKHQHYHHVCTYSFSTSDSVCATPLNE